MLPISRRHLLPNAPHARLPCRTHSPFLLRGQLGARLSSTRAVPLNPEEVSVIRIRRDIAAKYGIVALVDYLVIHATVFATAYFAIRAGRSTYSVVGGIGAATMAAGVVKSLQSLTMAAT